MPNLNEQLVIGPPDFSAPSRQTDLNQRLKAVRAKANFMKSRLHVRDGVTMNVFIRHEGLDKNGKELPNDGTYFPAERMKKAGEDKKKFATSPFATKDQFDDPAELSSSGTESDKDIDIHDDAEETNELFAHRFTIDIIARYPDTEDNLVLHWGMSRKKEGAWGTPDASFFPPNTKAWHDGLAS